MIFLLCEIAGLMRWIDYDAKALALREQLEKGKRARYTMHVL